MPTLDSSTSSVDQSKDPVEFAKLVKIIRDRRWRAGRRGDEALVNEMNLRLDELLGVTVEADRVAEVKREAATAKRAATREVKAATAKRETRLTSTRTDPQCCNDSMTDP